MFGASFERTPLNECLSLSAFETYLVRQEHSEYLQTLLTFKTVKCKNPFHNQAYQMSQDSSALS